MLSSGIVFVFLVASCGAEIWDPDTADFTAHPVPSTSSYAYSRYLANCSRLFHSLVNNCGDGKTNCPILTNRTPPSSTANLDTIIPPNSTTFQKLLTFYYYNIDPAIANARTFFFDDNDLHDSDFNNATNHAWMCKRLNYRHLFYYEMATSETLAKLWEANSIEVTGPFAYFYLDPHSEYDAISTYTEVPELPPFLEAIFAQTPWTPARFIDMVSKMKTYYQSQVDMGFDYTPLPYQRFYLQYDFAKILNLALNAKKILTGNALITQLNSEFERIKPIATIFRTTKAQVLQFINAVTQRWGQTSDITQRYHWFSQIFFEMGVLQPNVGKAIGQLYLEGGQVADFYYLNYFFGLPN
uniref:Uncharacterized protein n=1 Tax=Panagrellus redivivus TaxID=6233 RepID=A0A7E4UQ20_PANRE